MNDLGIQTYRNASPPIIVEKQQAFWRVVHAGGSWIVQRWRPQSRFHPLWRFFGLSFGRGRWTYHSAHADLGFAEEEITRHVGRLGRPKVIARYDANGRKIES